jgi:hypothetical protein
VSTVIHYREQSERSAAAESGEGQRMEEPLA